MGSYLWQNRWPDGAKANRPASSAYRAPLNRLRPEEPALALVLLLREPRALDVADLAQAVRLAFGVELPCGQTENGIGVIGETPQFLVQLPDRLLAVQNVAGPYFDNPATVAAGQSEVSLREAVACHTAWLSIECLYAEPSAGDPYDSLARLAAALLDPGCLALCDAARRSVYLCDAGLAAKLRGPDPSKTLAAGNPPPVVAIAPDDPRLLAAVREARRRWPEFVSAFEQRENGQLFSVKIPVREGKLTEYMWLSVSALEHEMIYGRLDNEPVSMRRIHAGDRLRIPVRDLNDWLFTRGDTVAGGFTIDVLSNAPKRPERP